MAYGLHARSALIPLAAAAISLLFSSAGFAAPSFTGLGDLEGGRFESLAEAVSADGTVVVGTSESTTGNRAFRWEAATGIVGLPDAPGGFDPGFANGVSADGLVVVGRGDSGLPADQPYRWDGVGGAVSLGGLPTAPYGDAHGVSADGSVVVGHASNGIGTYTEAFRWDSANGMQGLGDLPGGEFAGVAMGVSADGAIVVGASRGSNDPGDPIGLLEAFRWDSQTGMVGLGSLLGGTGLSHASAISADGSVVVGFSESQLGTEAFRWDETNGMQGLGDLTGGLFGSNATAISADGAVIVGAGHGTGPNNEAFIWDADNGMQPLQTVLISLGLDLSGWTLDIATGVSADGRTIVGNGRRNGNIEGWIAVIPEPNTALLLGIGLASLAARREKR